NNIRAKLWIRGKNTIGGIIRNNIKIMKSLKNLFPIWVEKNFSTPRQSNLKRFLIFCHRAKMRFNFLYSIKDNSDLSITIQIAIGAISITKTIESFKNIHVIKFRIFGFCNRQFVIDTESHGFSMTIKNCL